MVSSLSKYLVKIPVYDIITVTLGAMMLDAFFTGFALNWFSQTGFEAHIDDFINHGGSPAYWKLILSWLSHQSTVIAPLLAAFFLLSGVMAVLLIYRSIVTILISLFYLALWICEWNYPSSWIFEFLLPASIGLCAGFAHFFAYSKLTLKEKILGQSFFGNMSHPWRILIILLTSVWLWYAIMLGGNAGEQSNRVGLLTAALFALLFFTLGLMDSKKASKKLNYAPWTSFIIVIIGSMLVVQVYANISVGWFSSAEKYSDLVMYYAQATNAPSWYKALLGWCADQADSLYPIQAVVEFAFAFLLSALIFRGPVLLFATGMFAMLMFAEFGVSAMFPPDPNVLTGTWELMFVTIVSLFVSLKEIGLLFQQNSVSKVILGPRLFPQGNIGKQMIMIIIASLLLWSACLASHVFGEAYQTIAWQAGVTFFMLLSCRLGIDTMFRSAPDFHE